MSRGRFAGAGKSMISTPLFDRVFETGESAIPSSVVKRYVIDSGTRRQTDSKVTAIVWKIK